MFNIGIYPDAFFCSNPVLVLVISIVFVGCVFLLHIYGKYNR